MLSSRSRPVLEDPIPELIRNVNGQSVQDELFFGYLMLIGFLNCSFVNFLLVDYAYISFHMHVNCFVIIVFIDFVQF